MTVVGRRQNGRSPANHTVFGLTFNTKSNCKAKSSLCVKRAVAWGVYDVMSFISISNSSCFEAFYLINKWRRFSDSRRLRAMSDGVLVSPYLKLSSICKCNLQNANKFTSKCLKCRKPPFIYISVCVSMAFPLSGTHHPQRLMSLNTAQSELIKQTTEAGEGSGEGRRLRE